MTIRYRRDTPELFKYNVLCVLSDGVNTKSNYFFADDGFYSAWRKVTRNEGVENQGLGNLYIPGAVMVRSIFCVAICSMEGA